MCALVWALLACAVLHAQQDMFVGYTVKDGLNDNHVSGICRDSRGFYWISSMGGLNRFDGTYFKSYFPSELAGNARLTDNAAVFFESRPNTLIVTVDNGRLFELDCIFPHLTPVPGFANRVATDFFRLDSNTLLVGCTDTVFVTDNRFRVLHEITLPVSAKGFTLKARPIDRYRLVVGNWKEQFILDRRTGSMTPFTFDISKQGLFNTGFDVTGVDTVHRWIYMTNFFKGTFKLDYSGHVLFHWEGRPGYEMTQSASKMLPDPQNDSLVWVAGTSGLTRLNIYTHRTYHYPEVNDALLPLRAVGTGNLYFDRNGKLWVTTEKGLYARNDYSLIKTWNLGLSEAVPPMNLIKARDGNMYVPKYYEGVYRIHPQTGCYEPFEAASMRGSWFIFEDGHRFIQGGRGTEITIHDTRTGQNSKSRLLSECFAGSELVVLGFRHSSGDWWFSGNAGGGLARVRGDSVTRYCRAAGDFSHSYLTHSVEDKNGDLWFSTNKSSVLLHWIQRENRFEEIDFGGPMARNHLYCSVIHCLALANDGSIWLAFDGSGLMKFSPVTRRFVWYTKKNGLPSDFVYNLVFDGKGRLWAGTRSGLACLEPATGKMDVFDYRNGFPADRFDNSCAYFDIAVNRLWIGASDKLLSFDPDRLLGRKRTDPAVFIDEVTVNSRPLDIRDTAVHRLRTNENNIHIDFVTLQGSNTGDVVYAYSLGGAGGPWVGLGTNRQVNFPDLGYGDYEFRLRAKVLGSEEWFYLEHPFHFSVATPWYRTSWFTVLMLLAALGLIVLVTRGYYAAKVRKQKRLMEKQLAIQAERDRISFDMHDDLGSGLTRIAYLSQMAMGKGGHTQELEKIKNTSQELVDNMSELIWAMKAENDRLPDMLGYLKGYAFDYLGANDIQVSFFMPEAVEERTILGEKRRHIFLVYKEALHNIVKHAGTREVSIRIETDSDLHLTITDKGKGFETGTNAPKKGNGLRNMALRTQRLGGHMEIHSVPGAGTVLRFRFPLDGLL